MRPLKLALLASLAFASAASAQDPLSQALQQYRRGMVAGLEGLLFQQTGKTTSIIYLKQYKVGEQIGLYCGEAFFGSTRQSFVIDMKERLLTRPAPKALWEQAGCNADGGVALIDLR